MNRLLLFLLACACSAAPVVTIDEVKCTASIRDIVHESTDTRFCAANAGGGGIAIASNAANWHGNSVELYVESRASASAGVLWDEDEKVWVPYSTRVSATSSIALSFLTAGSVREGIARYQLGASVLRGMDGGGFVGGNFCQEGDCYDSGEFTILLGSPQVMELSSGAFAGYSEVGGGAWSSGMYKLSFYEADGITPVQIVPEPATWLLSVLGLAGMALCGRRTHSHRSEG